MNWIVNPMSQDLVTPNWCFPVACAPVVCSEKIPCPSGAPGVCYCWGGYSCPCKGGNAYATPDAIPSSLG